MTSLETELHRANTSIAAARSRLSAAKLSNNLALVGSLEAEIAAAEARRNALRTVGLPEAAGDEPGETAATTETAGEADDAATNPEPADGVAAVAAAQQDEIDAAEPPDPSEGVTVMSEETMPIDAIERASRQLEARRAEVLARHAEELKSLEADQREIEAMAQAMSAFMRKYNLAPPSSVVRLDEERDMRMQSHG